MTPQVRKYAYNQTGVETNAESMPCAERLLARSPLLAPEPGLTGPSGALIHSAHSIGLDHLLPELRTLVKAENAIRDAAEKGPKQLEADRIRKRYREAGRANAGMMLNTQVFIL